MNVHPTGTLRVAQIIAGPALAGLLAGSAAAAAPSHRVLSLPEAIEQALRANPAIGRAAATARAADGEAEAAGRPPNPMVRVSYQIESVETRVGPQEQMIALEQRVPWPGTLREARAAARGRARAERDRLALTEAEVIRDVRILYHQLQLSRRTARILSEHLQLLEQAEASTSQQVRGGARSDNLLKIRIEQETVRQRMVDEDERTERLTARLNSHLGRSAGIPVDVTDLPAPPPLPDAPPSWIEQHPLLTRLRHLYDARSAEWKQAGKNRFPDFRFGVQYIQTGEAMNPAVEESGKDPWMATVALDIPLWQDSLGAEVESRASRRQEVTERIRETRLRLQQTHAEAVAAYRSARRSLGILEQSILPSARQVEQTSRQAMRTGSGTFLDWLDAERSLLDFQLQRARLTSRALQSGARIKFFTHPASPADRNRNQNSPPDSGGPRSSGDEQ